MTDATYSNDSSDYGQTASEAMESRLSGMIEAAKRLPAAIRTAYAEWRTERDFDRIHDSLARLNDRQLAMLGLSREHVYSFAEDCVFKPERRPVLDRSGDGPVLAIAADETRTISDNGESAEAVTDATTGAESASAGEQASERASAA